MEKNLEIEHKILLTKQEFEKLIKGYENIKFITQVNTYYDTEDQQLKSKKMAMRIRTINDKHIFTLKQPTKQGVIEHECDVAENSIVAIKDNRIQSLLDSIGVKNNIVSLGSLTTHRAIVSLDNAELCFDINEYNGITDYEVEYEYTKKHDGIPEFNNILKCINKSFTKNCKSKIGRALC